VGEQTHVEAAMAETPDNSPKKVLRKHSALIAIDTLLNQ
jgi:hypothetical protein